MRRRPILSLLLVVVLVGPPLSVPAHAARRGTRADARSSAPRTSRAEALATEGKERFQRGDFAGAHARFQAALVVDPGHPTALFNAALSARKGALWPQARAAYVELLRAHPEDLDVVWGLAEVERGIGDRAAARALYARIVAEEQRPGRDELVRRAGEMLALLDEADADAAAGTPAAMEEKAEPSSSSPASSSPASSSPASSSPASSSLASSSPASSSPASSSPASSPPASSSPASSSPVSSSPVSSSPASSPPASSSPAAARGPSSAAGDPSVPFLGDALVVRSLVDEAGAAGATGHPVALSLLERAHAVDESDPLRTLRPSACRLNDELARGERALEAGDAAEAVVAFRRALACDGGRVAPLWGLSRAFDVAGARGQGRRHAALYVAAAERAPPPPDVDEAVLFAARLRAEMPTPAR